MTTTHIKLFQVYEKYIPCDGYSFHYQGSGLMFFFINLHLLVQPFIYVFLFVFLDENLA